MNVLAVHGAAAKHGYFAFTEVLHKYNWFQMNVVQALNVSL